MSLEKLTAFYGQLTALSSQTEEPRRLSNPHSTITVTSPVCGSRLTMDFIFDDERIGQLGFEVEACALTRAALAAVLRHARGKNRGELEAVEKAFRNMLEGKGPAPDGDWADLAILAPAKDYPARHNSMMLPFEAVSRAFAEKP